MSAFEHVLPSVIRDLKPKWGIVLGSGLGEVAARAEVIEKIPYHDVPGLPQSRVAGHAGQFVIARIAGESAVIAQGRVHLYEGHSAADATAGIRFMAECGIERVILTNAAGSLNPSFTPGEWMMISDHLNLTGTSPLIGGPSFFDMSTVYSAQLRDRFRRAAGELRLPLHEGVYAGMLGPQYETPAEIRMLGKLGADAVGMSTVLEAIQARALGLEVAGLSCLSNWAAGISGEPITHEEVLRTGASAAEFLVSLLERVLQAGMR